MLLLLHSVNWCDVWDVFLQLATPLTILFAYVGYRMNRKKHFYDVIQACQKRYLDIVQRQQELELRWLKKKKGKRYIEEHLILFRDHMGLVSEEITYIREGMLPDYVGKAWLSHMASRVPYYKGGVWANRDRMMHGENQELTILAHDRMLSTFTSFDQLKLLFSEPEDGTAFRFDAPPADWYFERQRFAAVIYRRIRPVFYRRWLNRIWPEWRRR